MFLENSLFQILLNMFVDKITSTSIESSNFTSSGWLCLIFGEMHKLSERYTIM